jgi:hypothetical protein
MSSKVLSLVAAAALLASVGAANAAENATANVVPKAKGPVTLTDNQLDRVTAGDAASQTAFLLATSTAELNNLLAISNFTIGFLSGTLNPFVFTP